MALSNSGGPKSKVFLHNTELNVTLYVDMLVSESHTDELDVTEHRVQKGLDVTDSIRQKARQLTMDVFITNEPLDGDTTYQLTIPPLSDKEQTVTVGGVTVTMRPLDNKPFAVSPGALTNLASGFVQGILHPKTSVSTSVQGFAARHDFVVEFDVMLDTFKGRLFSIATGKKSYQNMTLVSKKMDRASGDGTGARFTLAFREIRIVESKTVPAPATIVAKGPVVDKGAQAAPEVPAGSKERESAIHGAVGYLSSFFH